MVKDYQVGGLSGNSFDVDADSFYLYLAVLNTANQPQILKLRTDLSLPATISYNPVAGSEVNLMAGDLSSYWIWAAGNFGGTSKVVLTETGGSAWYVQNDNDWLGTARPVLVGPGDDSLLTTSAFSNLVPGPILWQNRYEGETQYWVEREIPIEIRSVHRRDLNFEDTMIGAYWYTGVVDQRVYYSPNSGFNWEDLTATLPDVTITTVIAGP